MSICSVMEYLSECMHECLSQCMKCLSECMLVGRYDLCEWYCRSVEDVCMYCMK